MTLPGDFFRNFRFVFSFKWITTTCTHGHCCNKLNDFILSRFLRRGHKIARRIQIYTTRYTIFSPKDMTIERTVRTVNRNGQRVPYWNTVRLISHVIAYQFPSPIPLEPCTTVPFPWYAHYRGRPNGWKYSKPMAVCLTMVIKYPFWFYVILW